MKEVPIRFVAKEYPEGWRVVAQPCNGGWGPIVVTEARGTANGAVASFAAMLATLREQTVDLR